MDWTVFLIIQVICDFPHDGMDQWTDRSDKLISNIYKTCGGFLLQEIKWKFLSELLYFLQNQTK